MNTYNTMADEQWPQKPSSKLRTYPVTQVTDMRNMESIMKYDAEMRKRDQVDQNTPNVQFFKGFAYVDKRPIDTEIADGKKQRVFYNQPQIYAKLASNKSAQALLLQQRPLESREFPEALDRKGGSYD